MTTSTTSDKLSGGCLCGTVRYQLSQIPLISQACHCLDCQAVSGSAFALNLWIENSAIELQSGELTSVVLTSASDNQQILHNCRRCATTLWSEFTVVKGDCRFVRRSTLDDKQAFPPAVHVFTRSKQDWLKIDDGAPQFDAFYSPKSVWSSESIARYRKAITAQKSAQKSA